MNIYDVEKIEYEIDLIAEANAGEIPEEKLKELVEAQTKSMEQLGKLCRYIRHLENFAATCKAETDRINALRQRAEVRLASVKQYLTPYVRERGKFDVDTFKLSIRTSKRVDVFDSVALQTERPDLFVTNIVTTVDKVAIKNEIDGGAEVKGARIAEYDNLQIK